MRSGEPVSSPNLSAPRANARNSGILGTGLCLETQGREMMARLVNDVVAEAMRLDLYRAAQPGRVEKANGARFGRGKDRNG
jgi:hypothetical protein